MHVTKFDFSGRVVFVTGSTRGIGWAAAEQFASAGAHVVLNGRTNLQALKDRSEHLRSRYNVEVDMVFGDISELEVVKEAYSMLFSKFKRLDVLVNNAGILKDALIGMIGGELIDSLVKGNLLSVINNVQAAARLMGRNPEGGSIINLSSIIGTHGHEGQMVYAATKAAVIGITKSAAKELAPKKIRVNAVAPGLIETDMIRDIKQDKLEHLKKNIGMGRLGTSQDVANTILFLASDCASYITGQILGVDGALVL